MTDLVVACVNVGDYCGRGREYVRKLRAGVSRHLPLPHRFVCVTDDLEPIEGVEFIAAPPVRPVGAFRNVGWLTKVELYRPGFLPDGRVLYIDLDSIITGDLVPLAEYDGAFAGLRNFFDPGFGTGLLSWSPEGGKRMWDFFETIRESGGLANLDSEQAAINRFLPDSPRLQDFVPGIYSYKVHCTNGLPDDARIVCFHGRPRPHEANGWVKEAWVE